MIGSKVNIYDLEKNTKKIFGYGAGATFKNSMEIYTLELDCIFERNLEIVQQEFINGVKVYPDHMMKELVIKDSIIIVFSLRFLEIKKQIEREILFKNLNIISFLEIINYSERLFDIFPEKNLKFLNYIVKLNSVCFDVGANFGLYSIALSNSVGQGGKVFSIEPIKQNFDELVNLIKTRNAQNIYTFQAAAADQSKNYSTLMTVPSKGSIDLGGAAHFKDIKYHSDAISSMDRFKRSFGIDSVPEDLNCGRVESVKLVSLDKIFYASGEKIVHFVKIDVEGAELMVLEGARYILKNFMPTIQIELFWNKLVTIEVLSFLASFGYKCFVLDDYFTLKPVDLEYVLSGCENNFYFLSDV